MQHTNTIVIGAGVSGLSAARLLSEKGIENIVLEKSDKPGGLIKCDVVSGHLFHRVGGHVFNTKVDKVNNWFWSMFNKESEFNQATRNAGIYIDGQFTGYPFENYLYMLDEGTIRSIVTELLEIEELPKKNPFEYDNFEAFLVGNFGRVLYDIYFKPYNQKIWKTDLDKVDLNWLEGKLPMPDSREIIISNILRKEEKGMVHSSFFYPKNNGSQFIVERLASGITIYNNTPVTRIERLADRWIVNGDYSADNIIYTADIRQLAQALTGQLPDVKVNLSELANLQSNGTSNLLCEVDDSPHSWLYLPNANIQAHRIIYTGNFSRNNQPTNSRKSCTVEFSGKTPFEEMKATLPKLPGNLKIIDSNYEPNSYVIQRKGDRDRIRQFKQSMQQLGFHLSGRFAEWEYYNMDKAMERAMEVVEKIRV